jgi:hypothetical protein
MGKRGCPGITRLGAPLSTLGEHDQASSIDLSRLYPDEAAGRRWLSLQHQFL